MDTVISERIRLDASQAVHLTNSLLVPRQQVELSVHLTPLNKTPAPGLWELAAQIQLDAPADYSVNFDVVH